MGQDAEEAAHPRESLLVPGSRWPILAAAGLIALATAAVYSNSFCGVFVFDDRASLELQSQVLAIWPPSLGWLLRIRPVANYTFGINRAIHGLDVWGYHAVNLSIHVAAGLLLFGLVRRTLSRGRLGEQWSTVATPLGMTIALIWSVHPLQTQAVTYVIQRHESLMGMLYLATLYAFSRTQNSRFPGAWYAVSILACAAGMGSKEVMVTAPILVLWYDRAFVAGSWWEILTRRKYYCLGLALTWIALAPPLARLEQVVHPTAASGGGEVGAGGPASPRESTADVGVVAGLTPVRYLLSQAGVLVWYLRLCFWPQGLCFDYDWPPVQGLGEAVAPGLVILALLALTVWCIFRRKEWSFVGAWFFLILAPTSSILPIRDLAVEHRMYLPLAAVVSVLVLAGYTELRRVVGRKGGGSASVARTAGVSLAAVVVLALGAATYARNEDYHSPVRLWKDTVEKRPQNPRAHYNLGVFLVKEGARQQAIRHFEEAVRLKPDYAMAYNNLGNTLLLESGRGQEASACFQRAIELDPDFAEAHNNLGTLLVRAGRLPEALTHFQLAVRYDPAFAQAHGNLGMALAKSDRLSEAIAEYEEALRLRSDYPEVHCTLGDALFAVGRTREARGHYRQALEQATARGRTALVRDVEARLRGPSGR